MQVELNGQKSRERICSRAVTHSWAFWGEDTSGGMEQEEQEEEVDRAREDESGKFFFIVAFNLTKHV